MVRKERRAALRQALPRKHQPLYPLVDPGRAHEALADIEQIEDFAAAMESRQA